MPMMAGIMVTEDDDGENGSSNSAGSACHDENGDEGLID